LKKKAFEKMLLEMNCLTPRDWVSLQTNYFEASSLREDRKVFCRKIKSPPKMLEEILFVVD